MQKVVGAQKIFTGEEWLDDHVAVLRDGLVEQVIPISQYNGVEQPQILEGYLVPAFIDLQVYGASGKLLAVYPEPETLALMHQAFLSQGTILFLPTVATNTPQVFHKCIDAVRAYWQQGGKGVAGLHLEGPWLNPVKRGAHVEAWIHAPGLQEVRSMLDYGRDVIKMITVAPEVCSKEILQLIADRGILLSAGHSDAGYAEAMEGFESGIAAVTHLYNAMSGLQHRAPGLVGAAFLHETVMASIIPDGHHVDFAAVTIAKKIMGPRLFAITDAVTDTDSGPYRHQRNGDRYECNGVLSGSALSMHKAFLNLVREAKVEMDEALRMCSLYPARLLKMDGLYGRIAPRAAGQFLLLDKQLGVADMIS